MFKIICFFKSIYRTITSSSFWDSFLAEIWGGDTLWVDGHTLVEREDGKLICEICGKISYLDW